MEKIREINGIKFRMATLEDHPKLIDFFFDIYLKDEPATKSRGGYLIRPLGIVNLVQNILYQNLSIIAEDIETGDVVGINTNCLFKRGQVEPPKSFADYCYTYPITHAYLILLSDRLWHANDIFKQYPEIDEIMFIHAVGVNPSHRRKGIAQNLVDLSLEVAENISCKCVTVMATNPYTRKIFEKLNFQTLRIVDSKNFTEDFHNGRTPIFPEVDTSAHIKFICSGGGTSTNGVPGTRPIARATSELQNLVSEKIQN